MGDIVIMASWFPYRDFSPRSSAQKRGWIRASHGALIHARNGDSAAGGKYCGWRCNGCDQRPETAVESKHRFVGDSSGFRV
jgi:hypothetical protein